MGLSICYCRVPMFTTFSERLCRRSVIRLPPLGYPIASPRQTELPRLYVLRLTLRPKTKNGGLIRELSSNYILPVQFFASHAHSPRVHSGAASPLSIALYNGRGKGRQFHCLRFLRSSRQVDCARNNR